MTMESTPIVFERRKIQEQKLMSTIDFPHSNIGFRNGFGENWRSRFMEDENLKNILEALEIPKPDKYRVYSKRMIGEDRCQVYLVGRMHKNDILKKIIIDVKSGIPTWEQFIDVTYNTPVDVEKRIIIYDDVHSKDAEDFPWGDELVLWNLVARNNRCGVDTYQVKAHFEPESNGGTSVQYWNNQEARNVPLGILEKLPTKEDIQQAEFWHEYYRPYHRYDGASRPDLLWPEDEFGYGDQEIWWGISNGIDMRVEWVDTGIFVYLDLNRKYEDAEKIWTEKRLEIENEFSGYELDFIDKEHNLGRIHVKLDNIDVLDLGKLNPSRKVEIANLIEEGEDKFYYLDI